MEGGRALRAGALVALAVGGGVLAAAFMACSPLELDLTEGDASDSSAPDGTVGDDVVSERDGAPAADGPSLEASADADGGPPIPCSQTSDCADAGATHLCEREAGVCVQCLSSTDCGGNTPHCKGNFCIACATSADCNDGGTEGGMICNQFIPRCASPCATRTDCTQSGQTGQLYCNQTAGYCVECTDDTYCAVATNGKHCFLAAGVCGCQANSDCPSQMPNCGPASPTGNRFCQM
jgi:hypothetical protein